MTCTCPKCGSKAFKRNGYTRHGKQNHRCLECGRQFSLDLETTDEMVSKVEFVNLVMVEEAAANRVG